MESNLVQQLINASEKAANIARVCRSNEALLKLLVQEKTGPEANARFEHDFKTLADVLIQETIKHDIGALVSLMILFAICYMVVRIHYSSFLQCAKLLTAKSHQHFQM